MDTKAQSKKVAVPWKEKLILGNLVARLMCDLTALSLCLGYGMNYLVLSNEKGFAECLFLGASSLLLMLWDYQKVQEAFEKLDEP